ncbi:MAG TPA: hypothetical protein VFM88_16110 [Vicinamibacteria bacterium]|nr:hypothetical protein [Vicinamibacteria bacterium]
MSAGEKGAALFAAVACLIPAGGVARADGIPWGIELGGAFEQAEETARPLLILFTGSVCGAHGEVGQAGTVTRSGDDCSLLEIDVLSKADIVEAASRYVPLILNRGARSHPTVQGTGEQEIYRRYQVATLPTLLLADPWGNEIVRLVGYTERDRVRRVLLAMPADFGPLKEAALALRQDRRSMSALVGVGEFYAGAGLGPIAERYYELAAATPGGGAAGADRQRLAVARGVNLLRLGKAKDAAAVFAAAAGRDPEGPQADAVLFGWAMACVNSGDRRKAESLSAELSRRFPESPYADKLKQNLGAAR